MKCGRCVKELDPRDDIVFFEDRYFCLDCSDKFNAEFELLEEI